MDVEKAAQDGAPLEGVALDISKYFDTISRDIAFEVLRRRGLSERILGVLRSYYARHTRRFRGVAGAVGSVWAPQRGVLQGCTCSFKTAIALMSLWADLLSTQHSVTVCVFIDDRFIWARDRSRLARATEETERFDRLMGQTCNIGKSRALSSTRVREALVAESDAIPCLAVHEFLKYLGAALSFRSDHGTQLLQRRFADAMIAADRVGKLPVQREARVCFTHACVLPKAVWGAEFQVLPRAMWDKLAAKACCTIWRMRRRYRAQEIVFVFFAAAHVIDPWSCAAYRAVMALARALREGSVADVWERVLARSADPRAKCGLLAVYYHVVAELGVDIADAFVLMAD